MQLTNKEDILMSSIGIFLMNKGLKFKQGRKLLEKMVKIMIEKEVKENE